MSALGTTNVDYSWPLYEHFQKLRSYRETRFTIDPAGFEVKTQEAEQYREEKIDLPPAWLRGFMQLQAAMSLPMRRVPVSREGLYSAIAFLKRHRAAKSPRALRFELQPGRPVVLVLEPWEQRIVLHSTPYDGARAETVRVWGRDRLRVLARLLPLLDGADVYVLGSGLPSFWVVRMGEMRLILGLSGWTSNDWTGSTALDQLAPPATVEEADLGRITAAFRAEPARSFAQLRQTTHLADATLAAGLNRLALLGQVIHDLPQGVYRWRQVMPVALSVSQIGAESPETAAGRELVAKRQVRSSATSRRRRGCGCSRARPAIARSSCCSTATAASCAASAPARTISRAACARGRAGICKRCAAWRWASRRRRRWGAGTNGCGSSGFAATPAADRRRGCTPWALPRRLSAAGVQATYLRINKRGIATMADAATKRMVEALVEEHVKANEMFTAFDITLAVRKIGGNVRHQEVRDLVHEIYEQGRMGAAYTRSLIDVGAPTRPYLYHRYSDDPSSYRTPATTAPVTPPPPAPGLVGRFLGKLFGSGQAPPAPATPSRRPASPPSAPPPPAASPPVRRPRHSRSRSISMRVSICRSAAMSWPTQPNACSCGAVRGSDGAT